MTQCPAIERCEFLDDKGARIPGAVNVLKKRYCFGGRACARRMVLSDLGPERVPRDLHPHELDRANRLLAEQR
jgi:hypothetical protein